MRDSPAAMVRRERSQVKPIFVVGGDEDVGVEGSCCSLLLHSPPPTLLMCSLLGGT